MQLTLQELDHMGCYERLRFEDPPGPAQGHFGLGGHDPAATQAIDGVYSRFAQEAIANFSFAHRQ